MSNNIRKARKTDVKRLMALLHQVNMVHHEIRPDLFKPHTTKYNEEELETLLSDENKPIFVYDDGELWTTSCSTTSNRSISTISV